MNKDITKEEHTFTCDQKLQWWGYGEWVEEPDLVEFEYKDFYCKILRVAIQEPYAKNFHMFGGHLCGYVKVPLELELHKKDLYLDFNVHGGITFNKLGQNNENWIGFDCAHSYDISPSMKKLKNTIPELIELKKRHEEMMEKLNIKKGLFFEKTYKNINFCIQECKSLVDEILQTLS